MSVSKTDKRKPNLYVADAVRAEMVAEARRLKRPLSWVVQRAWEIARKEIKKIEGE
jgi:uncharacterized small protein (TIGR04563 family)